MKERKLSEKLAYWRAERPDEWIMDEFIREAKKLEDSQSQWISVNDRLPEYEAQCGGVEFAIVLVSANGIVCEGLYSNGKWTVLGVEVENNIVTHWQYKPEPPKEREE
jgi:hypothetical protein